MESGRNRIVFRRSDRISYLESRRNKRILSRFKNKTESQIFDKELNILFEIQKKWRFLTFSLDLSSSKEPNNAFSTEFQTRTLFAIRKKQISFDEVIEYSISNPEETERTKLNPRFSTRRRTFYLNLEEMEIFDFVTGFFIKQGTK